MTLALGAQSLVLGGCATPTTAQPPGLKTRTECLLVPGPGLDAGDTAVNQTKVPIPQSWPSREAGRQTANEQTARRVVEC